MSFLKLRPALVAALSLLTWAGMAFAQAGQTAPSMAVRDKTAKLELLEGQIGPLRRIEQQLKSGELIAFVKEGGAVYPTKAELLASLSAFVIHIGVMRWHETGDYNILARLADPDYIRNTAAAMLAKIQSESNDFLSRITESRIEVEKEIRLLREQLEAAGFPAGSLRPPDVPPGNLTTKEERDAMKKRADTLGVGQRWHADDLGKIHAAIWSSKTKSDLALAAGYMNDYASCHEDYWAKVNALDAQRKRKPMSGGEYVGAKDEITRVLRRCLAAADGRFKTQRQS
jgi:hypothetical protein